MRKITQKGQKGFTLIELLVVIAIIGILATIVLTSLGTATKKAKDSKIQGQVSSMRAQAQLYTGAVPAVAASPCVLSGTDLFGTATAASGSLSSLLGGGIDLTGSGCYAEAVLPSNGGKWAVAIKLVSSGSFACSDYTGQSIISAQTTALLATGGATTFTCIP